MDTSEKYIEMCRKATKIQDGWIPEIGDIVGGFDTGDTTIINAMFHTGTLEFLDGGSVSHKATVTWLPQQDQLQKMIGEYSKCANMIYDSIEYSNYPNHMNFKSMEQLWLAIVMYEKHDKSWNGEEWIGD